MNSDHPDANDKSKPVKLIYAIKSFLHACKSYSIFIITLVCSGVIVSYPLFDYDLYWHLANGREMLTQHYIVNSEIFSFTHPGVPFVNHEWLAQALLFWIYQLWGGLGLNLVKVLLAVITAAVLYSTCRMLRAGPFIASFLTLTAVLVCISRFNVRPELFSLLNLSLLSCILHGYLNRRISERALYIIPVIMLLWDWLHGAVYGAAFLTALAASENIKHWILSRRHVVGPGGDLLPRLNLCMAITLAVMLLNPYGLLTYDIFIEFFRDNPLAQRVGEFLPPTWDTNKPFWLFLAMTGIVMIACRKLWDLTHFALLLPFAALALRYERATAIFALIAVPVLAVLLPPFLDDLKIRFGMRLRHALVLSAGLALAGYITAIKLDTHQQTGLGFRVIESGLPAGSARFIKETSLPGNMYNPGHFGGYLAFALAPQYKIFQYNHHMVFGDTLRFMDHPEELEPWHINYAVVTFANEIQLLFPPAQWAPLYHENGASLVIRRTPENAEIIRNYETFYYQPYRYSFDDFRRLAADPRIYPRLMHEMGTYLAYRRDLRVSGLFVELLSRQGELLPAEQRAALAKRALRFNFEDGNLLRLAQSPAISRLAQ